MMLKDKGLSAARQLTRRTIVAYLRGPKTCGVDVVVYRGRNVMGLPVEKRRTMWALTADEMKECRWFKPLRVAQIEVQRVDAGRSLAAFEFCWAEK